MVCQAASQTRFRALKHEGGIAGTATIIVRVIACFQPLQDCQAEYFRQLLKPVTDISDLQDFEKIGQVVYLSWMEGVHGSGFSRSLLDWNSYDTSELNIQPDMGNPTVGFAFHNTAPAIVSTEPLRGVSGLPHPRMGQSCENLGWFYCLPRYHQAFAPATRNLHMKDGLSVNPSAKRVNSSKLYEGIDVDGVTKFFVFDQPGGQTTQVFGPENNGIPIPHVSMARSKHLGITVSRGECEGCETVSEGRDENEDADTGNEMHEDTEELDALLYSDDESEYSSDGDDDEVTSTGHSPSTMTDHLDPGYYNSFEKDSEEVASSLWPLSKKRKLVNEHHHDPLPLVGTAAAEIMIRNFDSDDAISSSGGSESISRNKAIKWAKIHETITVLQSLVPGVKGKNPVLILDEAIGYLKLLKLKAAALGLGQL